MDICIYVCMYVYIYIYVCVCVCVCFVSLFVKQSSGTRIVKNQIENYANLDIL